MINSTKKNILTIIFSTILITALIYLYNPSYIIASAVVVCILSTLLFFFYDTIKSKGKSSGIVYGIFLILVLSLLFFYASAISKNALKDLLSFFLFGKVSDGITFQYSIIIGILLCVLITSFVFYFTSIIFRNSALFLISLIPCALYTKRNENIPLIILVLIISFYISVMIHCKQVNLSKSTNVRMNSAYKKSIFIFIIITVIITVAIPKPNNTPFRSVFLNLFGDKAGNGDNIETNQRYCTNTSSPKNYYNQLSDKILFEVESDEPLYLRFQVFDLYSNNQWSVYKEDDFGYGKRNWRSSVYCNDFLNFLQTVRPIFSSSDAIKKYKISLPNIDQNISNKKSAVITYKNYTIQSFLNTINTYNLESECEPTYKNANSEIYYGKDNNLNPDSSYKIYYNAESFYSEDIKKYAKNFNKDNYENLLSSLFLKIQDKNAEQLIRDNIVNAIAATYYYDITKSPSSNNLRMLAEEITKDCNSDIEKAQALESYFVNNGYKYDLKYTPPQGHEDIDYFIFDSKKGTCIDYATALTLMAREVGLPARYVEGYLVNEKDKKGKYVVREKDGHAFTEIYISGIGWMTFDSTVPADDSNPQVNQFSKNIKSNINHISTMTIIIIIVSIFLIFIAYQIFISKIIELLFRISLKFKNNNTRLKMLYRHLRNLVAKNNNIKEENLTCNELRDLVFSKYNVDISEITTNFEKVVFGNLDISIQEWKMCYSSYCDTFKSVKKHKHNKNLSRHNI